MNRRFGDRVHTIWRRIADLAAGFGRGQREKAASLTAFEAREMENMFVLLLLGSFTGMPAPPSFMAVELLPHLEHELKVLNNRAQSSTDSLAELMGMLDAD